MDDSDLVNFKRTLFFQAAMTVVAVASAVVTLTGKTNLVWLALIAGLLMAILQWRLYVITARYGVHEFPSEEDPKFSQFFTSCTPKLLTTTYSAGTWNGLTGLLSPRSRRPSAHADPGSASSSATTRQKPRGALRRQVGRSLLSRLSWYRFRSSSPFLTTLKGASGSSSERRTQG